MRIVHHIRRPAGPTAVPSTGQNSVIVRTTCFPSSRFVFPQLAFILLLVADENILSEVLLTTPGFSSSHSVPPVSDAHESSILAEALGLASIFLPRNRLALLEPYSITLGCSPHSFSVVPPFSTPLDATRLYSRGDRTPRRPSTRLVLDSPTRVHHCRQNCVFHEVSPSPYDLWPS
jgi:hypothetical protein